MRRAFLLTIISLAITAASEAQDWSSFGRGAIFGTYVTQTGPREPQRRLFSTNWFEGGVRRALGNDASIELRGRGSIEPVTIPREGYPQLLQYVSAASGGPLLDHMRPQDFVQELALRAKWRFLRLDLAPVGDPPLGTTPFEQRASSLDFAEAPFAYDIQESFHLATRMAGLAVDTKPFAIEGAVFHASVTGGRHTAIDDGKVDSWSGRVTLRPVAHLSIQASRGSLGDAKRNVTTGSITYEGSIVAASAIWTRRDVDVSTTLVAYGAELAVRAAHNVFSLRVEEVDRPAGIIYPTLRRTNHFTVSDVVDVLHTRGLRAGVGINIDYQTQTHELQGTYGHKPQSIYTFVRVRTE
jgi:hypothetical protein